MDRRFPNLRPIDGSTRPPGVADAELSVLRSRCVEVFRRTAARAWVDLRTMDIVFGYARSRPNARGQSVARIDLVLGVPLRRPSGKVTAFDPVADFMGVDDVVYCIQIARVDPKKKERWRAQKSIEDAARRERAVQRAQDETTRPFLDKLEFNRRRAGMGRHWRGSAVVSGLKTA